MAEVFVSWTRADGDDGPRRFAQSLRSAGLSVWLDEDRIAAFETIPDSVREGLSGAKVLVAWYSATYTSRRACREELTLALLAAERVSEGEKRVLVVNPEEGLDHVVEARLLDRRFAGGADLDDLDALAAQVKRRVGELDAPFGALPRSEPITWHGGEGYRSGSVRFVGRLTQFWQIHNRTTAAQRSCWTPGIQTAGSLWCRGSGVPGSHFLRPSTLISSGPATPEGWSGCRLWATPYKTHKQSQIHGRSRTHRQLQTTSSAGSPSALAWSRRASMILTPCGRWSGSNSTSRATHALGRRRLAKRAQRYCIWRMELRFGPCRRTGHDERRGPGFGCRKSSSKVSNRTKPSCCLPRVVFWSGRKPLKRGV